MIQSFEIQNKKMLQANLETKNYSSIFFMIPFWNSSIELFGFCYISILTFVG